MSPRQSRRFFNSPANISPARRILRCNRSSRAFTRVRNMQRHRSAMRKHRSQSTYPEPPHRHQYFMDKPAQSHVHHINHTENLSIRIGARLRSNRFKNNSSSSPSPRRTETHSAGTRQHSSSLREVSSRHLKRDPASQSHSIRCAAPSRQSDVEVDLTVSSSIDFNVLHRDDCTDFHNPKLTRLQNTRNSSSNARCIARTASRRFTRTREPPARHSEAVHNPVEDVSIMFWRVSPQPMDPMPSICHQRLPISTRQVVSDERLDMHRLADRSLARIRLNSIAGGSKFGQ